MLCRAALSLLLQPREDLRSKGEEAFRHEIAILRACRDRWGGQRKLDCGQAGSTQPAHASAARPCTPQHAHQAAATLLVQRLSMQTLSLSLSLPRCLHT